MPKGIDELDLKLIQILQRDARASFTKIAEELNRPDTTVHFRIKKLKDVDNEQDSVISRFSALVKPEAYGFHSSAVLRIQIGGHILPDISRDRANSFAKELSDDDHFLWVALDSEPTIIHAIVLGADSEEIEQHSATLKKSPDVLSVDITHLGTVVKGWEISGKPE